MDTFTYKLHTVVRLLRHKKNVVSFAESCTGGKLSARLTEIPGVSDIFMGSVVCYANSAKEDILGVLKDSLIKQGAVSEVVALQMAQGVRRVLKTTWATAVTGIAGPDGGTQDKPVGTVCFGIAGPGVEYTEKKLFTGTRVQIQEQSAERVLELLIMYLEKE
ncbi:MAG: CinA family protein [Bdellovibrionaceae bacterium]|nr:CinA family protein [Pseudobdellovibrionaceae bacterium]